MRQLVQIKKILDDTHAEIFMERPSACGGNCHDCGGCAGDQKRVVIATAVNNIGARVGDQVYVEAETGKILIGDRHGISGSVGTVPGGLRHRGFRTGLAGSVGMRGVRNRNPGRHLVQPPCGKGKICALSDCVVCLTNSEDSLRG